MKELILTVGLPRSGKSTWAMGTGRPVVSCDAIRQALGVYPFVPAAEPMVWNMAKYMVRALFNAGHDIVILDTTAITEKRRSEWISRDWRRSYKIFDTSAEVCKERAIATNQEYLVPIIERMDKESESVLDHEQDLY